MKSWLMLLVFGAVPASQKLLQERVAKHGQKLAKPVRVEVPGEGVYYVAGGRVSAEDKSAPVTFIVDADTLRSGPHQLEDLMVTGKLSIKGDFGAAVASAWLLNVADDPYPALREPVANARAALYERWGAKYPLGSKEGRLLPAFGKSMPNWPSREQYIVLETGKTKVVATDGLADPSQADPKKFATGYGFELWAETDEPLAELATSWLAETIRACARAVTASQLSLSDLQVHGMLSMELPAAALKADVPKHMLTRSGAFTTCGC